MQPTYIYFLENIHFNKKTSELKEFIDKQMSNVLGVIHKRRQQERGGGSKIGQNCTTDSNKKLLTWGWAVGGVKNPEKLPTFFMDGLLYKRRINTTMSSRSKA